MAAPPQKAGESGREVGEDGPWGPQGGLGSDPERGEHPGGQRRGTWPEIPQDLSGPPYISGEHLPSLSEPLPSWLAPRSLWGSVEARGHFSTSCSSVASALKGLFCARHTRIGVSGVLGARSHMSWGQVCVGVGGGSLLRAACPH